jgi:hypothetical protein
MREHQEEDIREEASYDSRTRCTQRRDRGREYVEDEIRRYRRRRRTAIQCDPLSPDDRAFIAFAQAWAPFGGVPAEDTFVQFGMTVRQFTMRVNRILLDAGSTLIPQDGRSPRT